MVRLASSRGGAVFEEHFEYRIRAANTTDGYAVYDVILVRQRCFAYILRDAKQLSWPKKKRTWICTAGCSISTMRQSR